MCDHKRQVCFSTLATAVRYKADMDNRTSYHCCICIDCKVVLFEEPPNQREWKYCDPFDALGHAVIRMGVEKHV